MFTMQIDEPAKEARSYQITVKRCGVDCPHFHKSTGGWDKYDCCQAPGGMEFQSMSDREGSFPSWCPMISKHKCPHCGK
jgi:hypothetical protein